jgi:serine/threonine-protein kinase
VADTAAALMRQHMFKAAPRLREQVPNAPQALDELISEMLRKEPAERPDMKDIATRLEQLLPEVSGKTAPLVEGISVPKVARKTGVADVGATDPLAATVGELSRSSGKEQRISGGSHSQLPQAKVSTRRELPAVHSRMPVLVGTIVVLMVALVLAIFVFPKKKDATTLRPDVIPVTPVAPSAAPSAGKPGDPATAPANGTAAVAATDSAKPRPPTGDAASLSEADRNAKAGRKKVGKGKVGKLAAGPDKPAEPAKPIVEEKPAKPAAKSTKDSGADIGVWRDP